MEFIESSQETVKRNGFDELKSRNRCQSTKYFYLHRIRFNNNEEN